MFGHLIYSPEHRSRNTHNDNASEVHINAVSEVKYKPVASMDHEMGVSAMPVPPGKMTKDDVM